jgi:membrane protein
MSKEPVASPWALGGLSWTELARRTWGGVTADDVFGRAAQIAYYFFFSIFPLAIFLVAVMGMVIGGGAAEAHLTDALARGVPASAQQIVRDTVQRSVQATGGGKLGFGIAIALFSASAGMVALISTLNAVYHVRERRGFVKLRAIALGLVVITGILVLIAIGLITVGGNLARHFAGGALYWLWNVIQYPVAIAFLVFSFALLYYFAPNVDHPEWHWVSPGAAVGVFLWVAASFGLREYLQFSNSYSSTYGLLGGVMVLLLWFYVTGVAILTGGEVDSIIRQADTARQERRREIIDQRPAA